MSNTIDFVNEKLPRREHSFWPDAYTSILSERLDHAHTGAFIKNIHSNNLFNQFVYGFVYSNSFLRGQTKFVEKERENNKMLRI